MDAVYDSLDNHLPHAPDLAKALVPMGMLLGWAVNQHLLSPEVIQAHERLILRIRFQEAGGSELLVACGGDLRRDLFNPDGISFLDHYYPRYLNDYRMVFAATLEADNLYSLEDAPRNYAPLAVMLTQQFMDFMGVAAARPAPGLAAGVKRLWRKLWA